MRIKAGFGIRDLTKENHWQEGKQDFKITKTTFLCFGGNGTIDSERANAQAARNERLMGLKPKEDQIFGTYGNIDVVSFYYGRDNESDQTGNLSLDESAKIINQFFLPLVLDEKTGSRLPLDKACRNFSRLIFSSFCYGSQCVNELMYDLQNKMLSLGYSREEVYQVYSHCFHISYSPLNLDSFLPFMQINSFEDQFNKVCDLDKVFEQKYGYKLNGIKLDYGKKHSFSYFPDSLLKPNQREIKLFTSKLVNTENNFGEQTINEHSSQFIDLSKNWGASKLSQGAKNAECVSKIAGFALATAGARSLQIERDNKEVKPVNLPALYTSAQSILEGYSEEELMSK